MGDLEQSKDPGFTLSQSGLHSLGPSFQAYRFVVLLVCGVQGMGPGAFSYVSYH